MKQLPSFTVFYGSVTAEIKGDSHAEKSRRAQEKSHVVQVGETLSQLAHEKGGFRNS